MKKAAPIILLPLLWVLGAGCESQGTPVRVQRKVFEVSTSVLRLHMPDDYARKLPESAYSLSVVTPNDLNAMLRYNGAKPRLLAESTRVINDWPAATDTWVYSPSLVGVTADSMYGGGGAGSMGARDRSGRLEVRFDYIVDHRGPQGQKLVESRIFYESRYPENRVLLFHAPVSGSGPDARRHVIAFEITRDNSLSQFGASGSRDQPPDVLAYR